MSIATLRRTASAIDAKTPAHRDRAIDGLRALALLAVPMGHWLLGGFSLDGQGALHNTSPLASFGFLAPISWVLQMLGIFFLVGATHPFCRTGGRWRRAGRRAPGCAAGWHVWAARSSG